MRLCFTDFFFKNQLQLLETKKSGFLGRDLAAEQITALLRLSEEIYETMAEIKQAENNLKAADAEFRRLVHLVAPLGQIQQKKQILLNACKERQKEFEKICQIEIN